MDGPDPASMFPMVGFPQVCYIKNMLTAENVIVGDFTYYDDPDGAENFQRNILYHFPFVGDKLIIGKFCAIARRVTFIMNGANHLMSGISTYPFWIFQNGWEHSAPEPSQLPYKGDTVIENDVWIGYDATIMPGVHIANGAIIASKSVVTTAVRPYAIVGGNPAREIKRRFSDEVITRLMEIAWWDWPRDKVTRHLGKIVAGDVEELMHCE